jgi:hypothetical protein
MYSEETKQVRKMQKRIARIKEMIGKYEREQNMIYTQIDIIIFSDIKQEEQRKKNRQAESKS